MKRISFLLTMVFSILWTTSYCLTPTDPNNTSLNNAPLDCPSEGAIIITEIMKNPDAIVDSEGEWFEVYNTTGAAIDMNGWTIKDAGNDSHVITTSVSVPAGGYAVFARNIDSAINGGITADYEYTGNLGNGTDEVILECSGVVIDAVYYSDATFPDTGGKSLTLNPASYNSTDNDNGANWCDAVSNYGAGDFGTPGAANDVCGSTISCPAPTGLTVSNITGTSAEISWTTGGASSWEIAIQAAGTGIPSNGVAATNPYTATDLTAGTTYEVYVRDICDANDFSSWTGPVNFTPNAGPGACPDAGSIIITEIMKNPDVVTDANGEYFEVYNTTETDIDMNGWTIKDADSDIHDITSSVIVPAGGFALFARNADSAINGGLTVDYVFQGNFGNGTDELILECSGTIIDEVDYSDATFPDWGGKSMTLNPTKFNAIDNNDGANWCDATSTYGAGDYGTPGAANDACNAVPTCTEPANISINNITTSGAEISWSSSDAAWDVAVQLAGSGTPATGTAVTETTYTSTGLTAGTEYDVYVRTDCGNDGNSNWVGPVSFTTSTVAITCPGEGAIIITEIMKNPDAVNDNTGEWFEVYNTTETDIDMNGWTIKDDGNDNEVITSSLVVPAGGFAVIGINSDPATNGGVTVDYVYTANLGNGADEVILVCSGTEIDRVNFFDAEFPDASGKSLSLNPDAFNATDNDTGANWCDGSTAYGAGDFGTPGSMNDACSSCGDLIITQVNTSSCDPDMVGVDSSYLQTDMGCDSLVVTTTSLSPSDVTNLTVFTCDEMAVGVDTVILSNQGGCDSLVITATVFDDNAVTETLLSETTCDPAMVGVDTAFLTGQAGCDSLVITTTTLLPAYQTNIDLVTCDPDMVGQETETLTSSMGCDSVIITTTTLVLPVDGITVSGITSSGAVIAWNANGTSSWEVAVVAAGSGEPVSGMMTTNNPYTATGLVADTDYDVYVLGNCGWAGPVSFTTDSNTGGVTLAVTTMYNYPVADGGFINTSYTNGCSNPTSLGGLAISNGVHLSLNEAEYNAVPLFVSGGCAPYFYEYWDDITNSNICDFDGMQLTRTYLVTDDCGNTHTTKQLFHYYEAPPIMIQTSTQLSVGTYGNMTDVSIASCDDNDIVNGLPNSHGDIVSITLAQINAQDLTINGCDYLEYYYWDTYMSGSCDAGMHILRSFLVKGTCNTAIARQNIYIGGTPGGCNVDINMFSFVGDYNGHSYYLSNAIYNWADAKQVAMDNNGQLVSITSSAENDFLTNNISEMFLIGLNDEATEGTMVWSNGEGVSFTNFGTYVSNTEMQDYGVVHNWDDKWTLVNQWVEKKFVMEMNCNNEFAGSNVALATNNAAQFGLAISPNPAQDEIVAKVITSTENDVFVQVMNSQGAIILTENGSLTKGMNDFRFDISELPTGMYFLKVTSADGEQIQKFMKL